MVKEKAKKGAVKNSFLTVHILVIIWIIGKILKTVAPVLLLRWSFNVFYYVGIIAMGPAFYLFSRAIIGKTDSFRFKFLLYIPGSIFFLILVTNPRHYLFYSKYNFFKDSFGPLFYGHFIVTYIFMFSAIVILIYAAILNKEKKIKALSLVLGALLPLFVNLQYVFDFISPMFDITPIIYNATLIVLGLAAFYCDFFDFIPNVVSSALNALPGAIMLDEIIYGQEPQVQGKQHKKYNYIIGIGKKKISVNRLINIETIFENTRQLKENVILMSNHHDQLKREIDRRVESLQQNERFRLAGEVHDILGYSLSSIICLLETCRLKNMNGEEYRNNISKALEITDSGIEEIKKSFEGNRYIHYTHWKKEFYRLLSETEIYGISSELILSEDYDFTEESYKIFFKILKESLTNCIKHSKATMLTIAIQIISETVHYYIIDNGIGSSSGQRGTGLNNMIKRIDDLGGEINFFSEKGTGFQISITIPQSSLSGFRDKKVLPQENSSILMQV